jgi:hypothetical protein
VGALTRSWVIALGEAVESIKAWLSGPTLLRATALSTLSQPEKKNDGKGDTDPEFFFASHAEPPSMMKSG